VAALQSRENINSKKASRRGNRKNKKNTNNFEDDMDQMEDQMSNDNERSPGEGIDQIFGDHDDDEVVDIDMDEMMGQTNYDD
jgi:hypothetical protein